jgi:solute:Na+ symporter, SSS family
MYTSNEQVTMFGLQIADIIVILVYFSALVAVGIWASRRIKSQEDYLLGGRSFGKLLQTFASFGSATSADGPVGVATTTFHNGAAGIWSALLLVFFTPVFWITSPWIRRMRLMTMGDFYEERFGSKNMAATYAIVATVGMMGLLSVGFTAMSRTIMAITPKSVSEFTQAERHEYDLAQEASALEARDYEALNSAGKTRLNELRVLQPQDSFSHINEALIVWIVCTIVLLYATTGGLTAAFYTDLLQGVFIIALSIILIPFAWVKISHLYADGNILSAPAVLHQKLPASFFEIFGSPTLIDFTWYFIVAAAVVAGITVVTQPNQMVANAAAKDEHTARVGFVTGVFMKRFCTILWGVVGLAAVLLYTGTVRNSDLIWGHATHDLLGSVGFGLIGLMIASMMAALMSAGSALMLTVSGLLMCNIYRPLVTGKSEKHYIWAGRVLGALFLIGGAIITLTFSSIFELLKFIWTFFVIFAGAFWLGLKWRRANRIGAWVSIVSTLALFYAIPLLIPALFPSVKQNEFMLLRTRPDPVVRTYVASEQDVEQRNNEIARWQALDSAHPATGACPPAFRVGEQFTKEYQLPSKAIFWSKQPVIGPDGKSEARGYIYPELIAAQWIGFDLERQPYAVSQTVVMLVPLAFSFLVLIVVAAFTPPNQDEITRKFFLKMRTKVRGLGPQVDAEDLQASIKNPERTKELLLFPNTQWEFYRWNKQDFWGFLFAIGVVFIVLGMLWVAVNVY